MTDWDTLNKALRDQSAATWPATAAESIPNDESWAYDDAVRLAKRRTGDVLVESLMARMKVLWASNTKLARDNKTLRARCDAMEWMQEQTGPKERE